MSMTKDGAPRLGVDLSPPEPTDEDENERCNRETAERDCADACAAITGAFALLDLAFLRASTAAGYGTDLYDRILLAHARVEQGIDMLRRPKP